MSDPNPKAEIVVCFRVTREECERLEQDAGDLSRSDHIRARLFDGPVKPRRTRNRAPVKDHTALSRLLGLLGASRLPNNLNQAVHLAHTGSFPVTPETEAALVRALAEVREMRALLLTALGQREGLL